MQKGYIARESLGTPVVEPFIDFAEARKIQE